MDFARCRGLRPQLMRLALAASGPAQLSVWRLLYEAMLHGVLRRPWDIREVMVEHYRLVSDAVAAKVSSGADFLNPWGLPDRDLPPGKRLHACGISGSLLFRDPLISRNTLDFINPLVSQPVVELCLRIPTYVHAAGGIDRAVARAAFAADLPPEIVARTWKGAADRHLQAMLDGHLGLVREMLLEGGLVRAGILDRKRLAGALSAGSVGCRAHATELFGYFCTEVWLRRWEGGA